MLLADMNPFRRFRQGRKDERAPLLDSEHCRQERSSALEQNPSLESPVDQQSLDSTSSSTFTWGPFVAILFMGLVQPMCFELVFPFINQMIVENGIVDDPEQVGFYSGLIESIFQVMSFLAIMPCSYISDHYGRKPVVIIGTVGMALSISLFGVSKTFWMMVATRCIGGTLGGTWSALKVMMAEVYTNKAHRAFAFSIFQIFFRLGQIAGQPLGGLLSHPARTMSAFDSPFWKKYPFSLPCFVSGTFAVVSVVWGCFALTETLPRKMRAPHLIVNSNTNSDVREPFDVEPTENPNTPDKAKPIRSVLTPHVLSVLTSIFVMTLVSETLFALYPLFAFTPIASGGLGLSEPQIGAHMAMRSGMNIAILFAYAPFSVRLGALKLYRIGMALWPIVIACLPILNVLARFESTKMGTLPFNAALLIFFLLWSLGNLVWPSSQLVVIEAPPTPEDLAKVNGLAQMVQTLTMALAPAFVMTMFAYSLEHQLLDGKLTYIVMIALGCGGALHSLTLKEFS